MEKQEFVNKLYEKALKIDIKISEKELEKFYQYMKLLIEWNKKMNLTAIIEPNDVILKHFIDSITINKYIDEQSKVMDIGTGAGFPGIPLKVLNEDVKMTLVDSLNKRVQFLKEVGKQLELTNIEYIHSRAEELAGSSLHRQQYDIVTSRAVARLTTLLEYMLPFVKIGGRCICMKGPNIIEELEEARKAIQLLGGEIETTENMLLPDSNQERNIIIIKKVVDTPAKYPRKAGIPSKQPIL